VQFVDSSGTVRLEGTLTGGVGAPLIWKGIWNAGTSYSVGDACITLNTGRYFLAICVAPNVNVNPFTDAGGPAGLGPHWFLEY
jgi:hypothetical protein